MTTFGRDSFDALRSGGVSCSFLRGDQPMGALVSVFAMASRIALALLPLLGGVASVLPAAESRSEHSAIEPVSAHAAVRYQDLKHFSMLIRWPFANGRAYHNVRVIDKVVVECTCILLGSIIVLSYGCILSGVQVFFGHGLGHFKIYWVNSAACLKTGVPEMEQGFFRLAIPTRTLSALGSGLRMVVGGPG